MNVHCLTAKCQDGKEELKRKDRQRRRVRKEGREKPGPSKSDIKDTERETPGMQFSDPRLVSAVLTASIAYQDLVVQW